MSRLLHTNVVPPRTAIGWMLCYLDRGSMLHVVPTEQAFCVVDLAVLTAGISLWYWR